jgi:hypothetical protein
MAQAKLSETLESASKTDIQRLTRPRGESYLALWRDHISKVARKIKIFVPTCA